MKTIQKYILSAPFGVIACILLVITAGGALAGQISNTITITDTTTGDQSIQEILVDTTTGESLISLERIPVESQIQTGQILHVNVAIESVATSTTFTNIVYTETFPQNLLTFGGTVTSGDISCSAQTDTITCTADDLTPGERYEFQIQYYANAQGSATIHASLQTDEGIGTSKIGTHVIGPGSGLLVTQSIEGNAQVSLGDIFHITGTITNQNTASSISNIAIEGSFPSDLVEIIGITASNGTTCQNGANSISCQITTLAPGAKTSFTTEFRAIQEGLATQRLVVSYPNQQDITRNISVAIGQRNSGILLTKNVVGSPNVNIGDIVHFTVTATNQNFTVPSSNIQLTDDYPENWLQLISISPSSGMACQQDSTEIRCQTGGLSPGESVSLSASYQAIRSGTAINMITASNTSGETWTESASVEILDSGALIGLRNYPEETSVEKGYPSSFLVEVTNRSSAISLQNISLKDSYASSYLSLEELTPLSAGITCSSDANQILCDIPSLAPQETVRYRASFRTLLSGTATNTVFVQNGSGQYTAELSSDVRIVDSSSPLFLRSYASGSQFELGEEVEIFLEVENLDQENTLNNIIIRGTFSGTPLEIIPESLPVENGLTCRNTDVSAFSCSLNALAPNEKKSFSIRFLSSEAGESILNTEAVQGVQNLLVSSSIRILVRNPGAPFVITKSPDKSILELNEEVTFTLVVTNRTRALTLQEVNILDDFPEDKLQILSVDASGITCVNDAKEINCRIPESAPGDVYTIVSRFKAIKQGTATNTATVVDQGGSFRETSSNVYINDPGNIFLITKAPNKTTVQVGEEVTYTVSLRNRTNAQIVEDVNIVDDFPEEYLELLDISTSNDLLCDAGSKNIQCNIQDFSSEKEPYLLTTTYRALAPGVAENILSVSNGSSQYDQTVSSSLKIEPGKINSYPARTTGDDSDTMLYNPIPETGEYAASVNAVAKYDRLIFSGPRDSLLYDWFLEDKAFGTLLNAETGLPCSEVGNGFLCSALHSVIFQSSTHKGKVLIRLSETDHDTDEVPLTIYVLPPAIRDIVLTDEEEEPLPSSLRLPLSEPILFSAEERREDGSIKTGVAGELLWEASTDGVKWNTSGSWGSIVGGVFNAREKGSYLIRAQKTQYIAFPGINDITQSTETVVSESIAISVGDAAPYIDSLHLTGNEGLAQGTSDTLYARLRHSGTFSELGDIELDLIRGKYTDAESIPPSAQYFSINLVPEAILTDISDEKTALLEIPFDIPLLEDIQDGPHTLRLTVSNKNGETGDDVAIGVLPVFLGTPTTGDADLDGKVSVRDAVLMLRFLEGNDSPSALQISALDADHSKTLSLRDYTEIFRPLLTTVFQ